MMQKTNQKWRNLLFLTGLFFFFSHYAYAQTMAESQTSPAVEVNQADVAANPTTLLMASQRVILLIDQGLASQLWAHTTESIKTLVNEEEFIRGIYASRRPLGAAVSRHWENIGYVVHPGSDQTPAGTYVSVSFTSNFAGKSNIKEHITFKQDADGVWRIAGYAIQ